MQVGGVGSEHNSNMHHVSNCSHESHTVKKNSGGARAAASLSAREVNTDSSQNTDMPVSYGFLDNILAKAKKVFIRIWGESGTNDSGAAKEPAAIGEISADSAKGNLIKKDTPEKDIDKVLHNNPYFAPVGNTLAHNSIPQKIKYKIKSVTESFFGNFAFSGRKSFNTKPKNSKENMRRRSRYRQDDVEIDCTLTDDSYLMDSYDRKGVYRELSTKL